MFVCPSWNVVVLFVRFCVALCFSSLFFFFLVFCLFVCLDEFLFLFFFFSTSFFTTLETRVHRAETLTAAKQNIFYYKELKFKQYVTVAQCRVDVEGREGKGGRFNLVHRVHQSLRQNCRILLDPHHRLLAHCRKGSSTRPGTHHLLSFQGPYPKNA